MYVWLFRIDYLIYLSQVKLAKLVDVCLLILWQTDLSMVTISNQIY